MEKVLLGTPVLLTGGTEMHTVNLAQVLMHAGYRTTICCYYDYEDLMVSKFETTGANVILMNLNRSDSLWRLMGRLRGVFGEINPDVVHVQYIAPGLIPIIAAKLSGIKKVFATVHQPGRPYGWKPKLLIRIAEQLCDAFFCNSKSVERSWFGDDELFDPQRINLRRKHFTIYNGIDVEKIQHIINQTDSQKLRQSLNITGKKVIGVIGRLRGEKGQSILLRSMQIIVRELPASILLVIGDGPDRIHLQQMSEELGIGNHVLWLGKKDPDEILHLYSIMDVVSVPSLFEGFGLVAAEAMAAGRGVIASNVDGLAEMIQGGVNGLLVPPGDIQALARGILELILNPNKAALMGANAQKDIEEQFSLKRFDSALLAAYAHYTKNPCMT